MNQPNESGAEVRCQRCGHDSSAHYDYGCAHCDCVGFSPEPASEAADEKEATGFDALAEMAKGTSFGALLDATKGVASLKAQVEQLDRERVDAIRLERYRNETANVFMNQVKKLHIERDQLRADVLRLEEEKTQLIEDECETDKNVRNLARPILGDAFVDGEGCVTPLEDIVEKLIAKLCQ